MTAPAGATADTTTTTATTDTATATARAAAPAPAPPAVLDHPGWVAHFTAEAHRRSRRADPDTSRGATADPALWRSLQRFQVGEDGDGTQLIAKAEAFGDPAYTAALRLFVAEEQNHARLLARLLDAGGVPLLGSHWSDALFVRFRRLLGLRLELMVLLVAEVVAVRYYRAVRDGARDPLIAETAGLVLADEVRHVPFHCCRLRESLAALPRPLRAPAATGWRLLAVAAGGFVALDHGPALRLLGVGRLRFLLDGAALAGQVARELRTTP
ncbi:hypothetical protein KNE206_46710 [Kitasatospora sp. NE20-6]|uniref:ferritin-like domain-containing protein n=1 Tax=Kitasatospora sp. NE20-6 TaxID=2859066 RepID=UPI0034DBABDE